jgi:hypothetical protein
LTRRENNGNTKYRIQRVEGDFHRSSSASIDIEKSRDLSLPLRKLYKVTVNFIHEAFFFLQVLSFVYYIIKILHFGSRLCFRPQVQT